MRSPFTVFELLRKEVWSSLARDLLGLLPAPLFDLRVVARDQYVGHLPPAEIRRPGVLRVLEETGVVGFGGERGRVAECPR